MSPLGLAAPCEGLTLTGALVGELGADMADEADMHDTMLLPLPSIMARSGAYRSTSASAFFHRLF